MRLPRLLLKLLPALTTCALAVAAPSAGAETLRIQDPVTDNYKASFNADSGRPELRTWFSIRTVSAGGTTWSPTPSAAIAIVEGGSVAVRAADGRAGTLTARTRSGPFGSLPFRVDPVAAESRGRWGMLAVVTDRAALRSSPATVDLALVSGGATLATGVVQYRHDAAVADVSSDSIEFNGPGGRWYVGGVATRLNWMPAPATAPSLLASSATPTARAPRVFRMALPVRTTKRLITLRVSGRSGGERITRIRVGVSGGVWGRWIAIRPAYSVVLPKGVSTRLVSVQLRDARGRVSAVVSRRIRCVCG